MSATPIDQFRLDHSIFQPSLYTGIREFWFRGISANASSAEPDVMMRWFGRGSPEEKAAFDGECERLSGEALQSISPDRLKLPPFNSHEDERNQAKFLSAPFFAEVTNAERPSEVLLSLLLLLDQMPRNMFREQHSLPLVYNHYDRIALALARTSYKELEDPISFYKGRPPYSVWFELPLIHSEDIEAHEQASRMAKIEQGIAEQNNDEAALKLIKAGQDSKATHVEPLRKFGRYPHRNQCLNRDTTAEEEKYLETADTYGVKQAPKSDKDEL